MQINLSRRGVFNSVFYDSKDNLILFNTVCCTKYGDGPLLAKLDRYLQGRYFFLFFYVHTTPYERTSIALSILSLGNVLQRIGNT